MALGFELVHLLERTDLTVFLGHDAFAGVLQHGVAVQRNIRAAPGVLGRGQVIGVGLAGHLEDGDGELLGEVLAVGEPLALGPGFDHFLGLGVAGFHFVFHVVEGIEHQQGVLEFLGGHVGQFFIVEQLDQRRHVVAALHGAEQFGGTLAVDQRGAGFAFHDGGEEGGLHVGGLVHARRDPVHEQVLNEFFFASGRVFQQFHQFGGLHFVQRLGRNALGGALFYVFAIGF